MLLPLNVVAKSPEFARCTLISLLNRRWHIFVQANTLDVIQRLHHRVAKPHLYWHSFKRPSLDQIDKGALHRTLERFFYQQRVRRHLEQVIVACPLAHLVIDDHRFLRMENDFID